MSGFQSLEGGILRSATPPYSDVFHLKLESIHSFHRRIVKRDVLKATNRVPFKFGSNSGERRQKKKKNWIRQLCKNKAVQDFFRKWISNGRDAFVFSPLPLPQHSITHLDSQLTISYSSKCIWYVCVTHSGTPQAIQVLIRLRLFPWNIFLPSIFRLTLSLPFFLSLHSY